MLIKVSEATDEQIDWLVTSIQFGLEPFVKQWVLEEHTQGAYADKYSTEWMLAGPIVDREKIATYCDEDEDWAARGYLNEGGIYFGPTPLIAAMRCYIASHRGDTVEVPDVLA